MVDEYAERDDRDNEAYNKRRVQELHERSAKDEESVGLEPQESSSKYK
jgi:hypothetical protein